MSRSGVGTSVVADAAAAPPDTDGGRAAAHPGGPVLAVEGIRAGYGGGPDVLFDVGFTVAAGQRVAVLGPNGGGKTTLFRVLLGELAPRVGVVRAPARIGVVPQTERSRLDFPVSALDVALMGTLSHLPWWRRPGRTERREAREALAAVGLADRADATFGTLSGGQRQRVLVARALVQDAQLLLLDEPFSGLDATSVDRLETLLGDLAAQGRTLLIATHDVGQATAWDWALCLSGRQVAFGAPEDVLTPEILEATYGRELVHLPAGRVLVPGC